MFSRSSCKTIIYFAVLFAFSSKVRSEDTEVTISLNRTISLTNKELYSAFVIVESNSTLIITFENINKNVSYFIVQAHSHLYNITLYNNTLVHGSYVTGTNVGLYSPVKPVLDKYFLHNPSLLEVKLYITVMGYLSKDPIPGGCNMEFPVDISPFMSVKYNKDYILVDAAPAKSPDDKTCLAIGSKAIVKFYSMYIEQHAFDEDSYFYGIRNLSTMNRIVNKGSEISMTNGQWNMRRMLAAYPGMGVVVVAVAYSHSNDSFYAVYVPTFTYACSPSDDGCELLDDATSQIFCALLFFVGLFVCFCGHRFFRTEMFLVGMSAGVIITYILISIISDLDGPALLGASVLSGLNFGAIWLLFWWFYGIPVAAVLMTTLNLGFLSAAFGYYRIPAGSPLLADDTSFWALFITFMILMAMSLATAAHLSNKLCCAILGAYATVFSIDFYIGSSVKYIIINIMRRAVVDLFNYAETYPPFQLRDLAMYALWVVLGTCGFLVQHYHNKGRPPFPPPPRSIRPGMPEPPAYRTMVGRQRLRFGAIDPVIATVDAPRPEVPSYSERTPLLGI